MTDPRKSVTEDEGERNQRIMSGSETKNQKEERERRSKKMKGAAGVIRMLGQIKWPEFVKGLIALFHDFSLTSF